MPDAHATARVDVAATSGRGLARFPSTLRVATRTRWVRKIATTLITIAVGIGTSVVHAGVQIGRAVGNGRSSVEPSEHRFRASFDEAQAAGERGDWGEFLEHCERALTALPEHETSRADRADVMDLVGGWRVDARRDDQTRRSIAILERYVADLRQAYGEDAEQLGAWEDAHRYLDDLRARLPADAIPPPPGLPAPPTIGPADSLHREHETSRQSPRGETVRRQPSPLVIAGAVTTGVGGVVMASLLGGWWWPREREYRRLKEQHRGNMCDSPLADTAGCPDAAMEKRANTARYTAGGVSLALGTALLTAGVAMIVTGLHRKKHAGRRTSSSAHRIQRPFGL
jgi:hypothetical protein